MNKEYLGDSVYAEIEHDMIKLTTENGGDPSNTIYLEPFVYSALRRYVANISQETQNEQPNEHNPTNT